jgi:hypothetical protein
MGTENIAGAVLAFLKQRGEAASSLMIADRFLRARVPDERLATRVLEPLLRQAGLTYEPDRGWTFTRAGRSGSGPSGAEGPGEQAFGVGADTGIDEAPAPRQVACAVAPAPERHRSRLDTARDAPGPIETRGGEVASPDSVPRVTPPHGIASVCLLPIAAGSTERMPPLLFRDEKEGDHLDWTSIAATLEGVEAVFAKPEIEAPRLLMGLAARGLPAPARIRSLGAAVRGAVRFPRGSGVEEICRILGVPFREGDTVSDAARNIASCLEAAGGRRRTTERDRAVRSAVEEARGGSCLTAGADNHDDVTGARAVPGRDRTVLTRAWLEKVPTSPGVYRFYDDSGKLLYVGKAANLKRRLSSHARSMQGASAASRGRGPLDRPHRVEYEVTGSELEALLREAKLIATRSPRSNVQREVHERGKEYAPGRAQALLFPARESGALSVVFVRAGRFEGLVRIGPRGGGLLEASRILKEFFRRSSRSASSGTDADSEILRSWLSRNSDSVSRVDLDACRGPSEALALIEQARKSRERETTHHRRA